ncbi:hypothetical protein [Kitasatospora sp. NPDC017646]|uniref:hypothetical protein n=1 Tax=Kitasatospora sp. NPDC017646 TaxID=3364024 RepID=UPI0037B1AAED
MRSGFQPLPDGRLTIYQTGDTGRHVRQTVAELRHIGIPVTAAPEFDAVPNGLVPPSPAVAAAGPGSVIHLSPPATSRSHDVAFGRHPQLGTVARNASDRQDVRLALAEAGFVRTSPTSDLFALDEPEFEGDLRTSTAIARLRDQGVRVAADLAFEPLDGPYTPTDPFATRLVAAMNRTPPSPEPSAAPSPSADPFETKLIKAPDLSGPAAPKGADPFNTVLHGPVGPSVDERRTDAMLHDRAAMSAEIASRLRAIQQQLRGDLSGIDPARIEAVIGEATTVLAGASKDLASAAAPAARPAAASPTSPRARAALAVSGQVRSGAALQAQGAAATATAAPAVDPRIAWAAGNRNTR